MLHFGSLSGQSRFGTQVFTQASVRSIPAQIQQNVTVFVGYIADLGATGGLDTSWEDSYLTGLYEFVCGGSSGCCPGAPEAQKENLGR